MVDFEALASSAFSSGDSSGFQFGGERMQRVVTIAPAADAPAQNGMPFQPKAPGNRDAGCHPASCSSKTTITIVRSLEQELAEHGFAVRASADAASLLGSIERPLTPMSFFDWALPRTSGIDLVSQCGAAE
jgi:hypothetical protein